MFLKSVCKAFTMIEKVQTFSHFFEKEAIMELKIIILVENYAHLFPHAEQGFCAYIEYHGKRYLFDTGFTGTCAIKNALAADIPLSKVRKIILSHGHIDHTGGLEEILKFVEKKEILAHRDVFSNKKAVREPIVFYNGIKNTRDYLERNLGARIDLQEGFYQIAEGMYMTGEVPFTNSFETISDHFKVENSSHELVPDTFTDDNSLIFDTPKGLVILTGCAHRGIVNIMTYAKQKLQKKVHALIGGTHLVKASEERMNQTVKALQEEEVDIIAPAHCTHFDNIVKLKTIFGPKFIPAFCGTEFKI